MSVIEKQIRTTQTVWGLDKDTAESMVMFVAMRQLVHDDDELLWEEFSHAYPTLHQPRKIRCVECAMVIEFFPFDSTIAVRDDGELTCLDCEESTP